MATHKKVLIMQSTADFQKDEEYEFLAGEALKHYALNVEKLDVEIHFIRDYKDLQSLPYSIEEYSLVGISVQSEDSYSKALGAAGWLKEQNPQNTIVLGGGHATHIAKNIIRNQKDIDYVVRFGGEEAFAALIRGDKPETIPNLVYKDEMGNVKENALNKQEYFGEVLFKPSGVRSTLQSARGCNNSPRCSFCSIPEANYKRLTPEQFINQIKFQIESSPELEGVTIVDDNFLINPSWLEKSAALFEKENFPENFDLAIYATPSDFTPEIIPTLKKLQVKYAFFGCDSGDEQILKQAGKRNTPEENIRAAQLAFDNDIKPICSYITLWPGETKEQMARTYMNAHAINSIFGKKDVDFTINELTILPGSRYFDILCEKHPEYKEMDNIDQNKANEDFRRLFYKNDEEYQKALKSSDSVIKLITGFNYTRALKSVNPIRLLFARVATFIKPQRNKNVRKL